MTCNLNFVWYTIEQTCGPEVFVHPTNIFVVATTQRPVVALATIGLNDLVYQGYHAPCSEAAILANDLYHPHPSDPTKYLQCDLWGDTFVRSCQPSYYYNPLSHTCVDGPVIYNPVGK